MRFLRLHGLIERTPHSYHYRVADLDLRVPSLFPKVHSRGLRPGVVPTARWLPQGVQPNHRERDEPIAAGARERVHVVDHLREFEFAYMRTPPVRGCPEGARHGRPRRSSQGRALVGAYTLFAVGYARSACGR